MRQGLSVWQVPVYLCECVCVCVRALVSNGWVASVVEERNCRRLVEGEAQELGKQGRTECQGFVIAALDPSRPPSLSSLRLLLEIFGYHDYRLKAYPISYMPDTPTLPCAIHYALHAIL